MSPWNQLRLSKGYRTLPQRSDVREQSSRSSRSLLGDNRVSASLMTTTAPKRRVHFSSMRVVGERIGVDECDNPGGAANGFYTPSKVSISALLEKKPSLLISRNGSIVGIGMLLLRKKTT